MYTFNERHSLRVGLPRRRGRLPGGGVWVAVLLACALALVGCGDETPATPLRVAINPWPGHGFAFLAEDQGYFEDEGLSVELLELTSLADARRIFEQGQADLLFGTLVDTLLVNERSSDPAKVILAVDYSNGTDRLLAQRHVRSLSDLRGRRIGIEPESLEALAVYLALRSAGIRLDEVTLVSLAQTEMPDAMRNGDVDAVQSYFPNTTPIESQPGVHCVWDSSQSPRMILDVLSARTRFLESRGDDIVRFLRACRRGQQFFREQPEASIAILARRFHTSTEDLHQALAGIHLLSIDTPEMVALFEDENNRALTTEVADALFAIGLLTKMPTIAPFDSRFVGVPSE